MTVSEEVEATKVTLRNFRTASVNLNGTLDQLGTKFTQVGANLEQSSDPVKRQPWRLR